MIYIGGDRSGYGKVHHNGSVWRAYAYFEAKSETASCQSQRPDDPSQIFINTVPDVWPKAVRLGNGITAVLSKQYWSKGYLNKAKYSANAE